MVRRLFKKYLATYSIKCYINIIVFSHGAKPRLGDIR